MYKFILHIDIFRNFALHTHSKTGTENSILHAIQLCLVSVAKLSIATGHAMS